MTQADFTVANQTFPNTRAEINTSLQALATNSAGNSAPSTTFANQWWFDSDGNQLYMRNKDNDAWVKILTIGATSDEVESLGENIFIDSTGKVGIGDSAPDTLLHISEGGEPPAEGMLILEANSATRQLRIQPPTNSDNGFIDYRGGNLVFMDDGTEVARFQGTTGFGIGSSNPARTLHVNSSDANVASFEGHQGQGLVISSVTAGRIDLIGYDDGASSYNKMVIRSSSAGDQITLHTDGEVTMPLQPAFLAQVNTGTVNQENLDTNGSFLTVAFPNEIFDQNADYNNSTYTFTAPKTGRYQLNAMIRIQNVDSASNFFGMYIATSNRNWWSGLNQTAGTDRDPQYMTISHSSLIDMDASDTAIVRVAQSGGTAQADIGEGLFSMYLAC